MTMQDRIDPEVRVPLDALLGAFPGGFNAVPDIVARRELVIAILAAGAEGVPPNDRVSSQDHVAPGRDGHPEAGVRVYRPVGSSGTLPGIFYIHGGGMVLGNIEMDDALAAMLCEMTGCVVVSVEYRLAPEFPDPVPREDCYTGLSWVAENGPTYAFDSTRILLLGVSAGGALAGGLAHRWRDEGRSGVIGQMLIYPMLDDRATSRSCEQFVGVGLWDRISNETGWTALLGSRRGSSKVSPYTAPARSQSLGGLPTTFLDVGTNDVLRDEIMDYATRLCQSGVVAELHLWPGACHGFGEVAPGSRSALLARHTRIQWIARQLADIESS